MCRRVPWRSTAGDIIQGIDISNNNGSVDFAQVRDAGFRFCIAKLTEGGDYLDSHFQTYMQAIRDLNAQGGTKFYPGAYHFARPDNRIGPSTYMSGSDAGKTEGTWFCQQLTKVADALKMSLDSDFLEPALDMETYADSGYGGQPVVDFIAAFLDVVRAETGRKGMIYIGATYWGYQALDTDQFARAGIPLWEVYYSSKGESADAAPKVMPGGSVSDPNSSQKMTWTPTLWQWSGGGSYNHYGPVPRIHSDVDIDRLMGDESLLLSLASGSGESATGQIGATSSTGSSGESKPPVIVQPTQRPPLRLPTGALLAPPPQVLDLAQLRDAYHSYTARVQGCLLSHGYGPDGLSSSRTGRPDGYSGASTEQCLRDFKTSVGLPADTVVDLATWWLLVNYELS